MALQAAADKDKRGPTVADSPIRPPCAGQKHLFDTYFMSLDTQKLKKIPDTKIAKFPFSSTYMIGLSLQ